MTHTDANAALNAVMDDAVSLLDLIYRIRVAAGDPEGRLMQDELVARIASLRGLSDGVINSAKDTLSNLGGDEWSEEILKRAAEHGLGNIRRVAYDPKVHGPMNGDIEPRQEMWFWGEDRRVGSGA